MEEEPVLSLLNTSTVRVIEAPYIYMCLCGVGGEISPSCHLKAGNGFFGSQAENFI